MWYYKAVLCCYLTTTIQHNQYWYEIHRYTLITSWKPPHYFILIFKGRCEGVPANFTDEEILTETVDEDNLQTHTDSGTLKTERDKDVSVSDVKGTCTCVNCTKLA